MTAVLVTGMSGVGKSTALAELGRRGFEVVDTDDRGWSEWSDGEGGYVWDEDRIRELLTRERAGTLFVSGCVSNQGRFYRYFDAVVLLSAPVEVLFRRLESRTTNPYGKRSDERAEISRHLSDVEPLLRETSTHEIDGTLPIGDVVARLAAIGTAASREKN